MIKPYLLTATDAKGRRSTFARESVSVEHIRAMLEREAYRDIEFHDDEVTATLRTQRPDSGKPHSAAAYRMEAELMRKPGGASVWKNAIRSQAIVLILVACAIGYGLWARSALWVALPLLMLIVWLWLVRRGVAQVDLYNALLKATARGDLPLVESLLSKMKAAPAAQDNEQLQTDLVFREAGLLARRGQLDRALAIVDHLRASPSYASTAGLFESRVASIHYGAERLDGFVQNMERAYELSAQGQMQRLDLAFAHARAGDRTRVPALLAGVERSNLPAIHNAIYTASEGICLLRDGNARDAADLLTTAMDGLQPFAANPAVWPFHGIIAGFRALALARDGRRDEARDALAAWQEISLACLDAETRRSIETEVLK
jgi:hypothetical protein